MRPGDQASGRGLLRARQTTSRRSLRAALPKPAEVDYHTLREDRCS